MVQVVITDLTRMCGVRICIAGYTLDGDRPVTCIRPEFHQFEPWVEPWLYSPEGVLRPFAVADFALVSHQLAPPHIEDWIVERRYTIASPFARELIEPVLTATAVDTVQEIYDGLVEREPSWFVPSNANTRSLGTLRPRKILAVVHRWREECAKWDYRLEFEDASGERFWLPVTDLAFRYQLDQSRLREQVPAEAAARHVCGLLTDGRVVFLRIGLTRPFGDLDRCFLQVTGVHSIPDYLDGKCHADFSAGEEDETPVIVPF